MAKKLRPGMRIHFMGIGGFGISAIARVMHQKGFVVSGCDLAESALIQPLRDMGIAVEIGHDPAHLDHYHPDALVISSAIPADNPSLVAAQERRIPVYKRMDILGELMATQIGVAVAGTHGKTSTTAMIAYILSECGFDPTFIVGGVLADYGTNARAGAGNVFVIEADEYDRMFMGLKPTITVLTTLEMDHPDMFPDMESMRTLFAEFIDLLPKDGLLIAGGDSPEAKAMAQRRLAMKRPAFTYDLGEMDWALTAWMADEVEADGRGGMRFNAHRLDYSDNDELIDETWEASITLPGEHNVANALAALSVASVLGVDPAEAVAALARFSGTGRRFEVKGEVNGVTVIDDYAHHPTAIERTLEAARLRYGDRPIWAVWQPHTYSRTKALLTEFAGCFYEADHVIITDIFRSRDKETFGISEQTILDEMDHPDAQHIGSFKKITDTLAENVEQGDVVIVMSAGDATCIAPALLKLLAER